MKIKIIFFCMAVFTFITSCGFKVLDKSKNNNFSVQEIRSSGEIRINHKIKNNIILDSKEPTENQIVINLSTKKIKSIKEKNIKNEITNKEECDPIQLSKGEIIFKDVNFSYLKDSEQKTLKSVHSLLRPLCP